MSRKIILTCAVTGNAPFNPKHPAMPVTPPQIAAACVEAAKAGASIVHIHVRHPETGKGSRDPELFKQVVDRVRSSGVNIGDAGPAKSRCASHDFKLSFMPIFGAHKN